MQFSTYTQVANTFFDTYLPAMTLGEMKVYLVIVRQTVGWRKKGTIYRKEKDRITVSQFVKKTGLSKRVISHAITSLASKGLIFVTDTRGNDIGLPMKRKGRIHLYYSLTRPSSYPLGEKQDAVSRKSVITEESCRLAFVPLSYHLSNKHYLKQL